MSNFAPSFWQRELTNTNKVGHIRRLPSIVNLWNHEGYKFKKQSIRYI